MSISLNAWKFIEPEPMIDEEAWAWAYGENEQRPAPPRELLECEWHEPETWEVK